MVNMDIAGQIHTPARDNETKEGLSTVNMGGGQIYTLPKDIETKRILSMVNMDNGGWMHTPTTDKNKKGN